MRPKYEQLQHLQQHWKGIASRLFHAGCEARPFRQLCDSKRTPRKHYPFCFILLLSSTSMNCCLSSFFVQVVDLHPTTCLLSRPAFVIYHDFVLASKNFIRIITDFPQEWWVIPIRKLLDHLQMERKRKRK